MNVVKIPLSMLPSALREEVASIRGATKRAIVKAAVVGERVAKENVAKASRILEKSIRAYPTATGVLLKASAPHAGAVEHGSRPHMPPVAPLIAWARQKLGAVDAKSVGWAIALKIKERGTKPNMYMARTVPVILATLRLAMAESVARRNARR